MRMLHVPNSYDDLDMDEDEFKAFRREGTKRERGGERERARARERERERERKREMNPPIAVNVYMCKC